MSVVPIDTLSLASLYFVATPLNAEANCLCDGDIITGSGSPPNSKAFKRPAFNSASVKVLLEPPAIAVAPVPAGVAEGEPLVEKLPAAEDVPGLLPPYHVPTEAVSLAVDELPATFAFSIPTKALSMSRLSSLPIFAS